MFPCPTSRGWQKRGFRRPTLRWFSWVYKQTHSLHLNKALHFWLPAKTGLASGPRARTQLQVEEISFLCCSPRQSPAESAACLTRRGHQLLAPLGGLELGFADPGGLRGRTPDALVPSNSGAPCSPAAPRCDGCGGGVALARKIRDVLGGNMSGLERAVLEEGVGERLAGLARRSVPSSNSRCFLRLISSA